MSQLEVTTLCRGWRAAGWRSRERNLVWGLALCLSAALLASPAALSAAEIEFAPALSRVDEAIRTNPSGVNPAAVESCINRRNYALRLYNGGQIERAKRSLSYCFDVLNISSEPIKATVVYQGPTIEELQARSAAEVEEALKLEPNIRNGLEVYRTCALCHEPEGWGLPNGSVPQIAGQHRTVVIKQLADIRAGNRGNVLMAPYATVEVIGGAQAIADVAGYIDTLEISVANDKGPGKDLERGKQLYGEQCARCHGVGGEGNAVEYVPRLQSQHYDYLVRQFARIKDGKRKNANAEMVEKIQTLSDGDRNAVLDYVSRLEPPPELQAPAGWRNPDFARREAAKP